MLHWGTRCWLSSHLQLFSRCLVNGREWLLPYSHVADWVIIYRWLDEKRFYRSSIVLVAVYRGGERFHCSPEQLIGAKHSFVLAEHTSHRFHDKQTSSEVANRERNWNTFADQFTVDSPLHRNYFHFFANFYHQRYSFFALLFVHPLPTFAKWVFDEAKWLRKSCEQKKSANWMEELLFRTL